VQLRGQEHASLCLRRGTTKAGGILLLSPYFFLQALQPRQAQTSRIERRWLQLSKAELVALVIEMIPDEAALDYRLTDEIE